MKKGDYILIGVLALSALALFVFLILKPVGANCVVYEDGVSVASFPLNKDITYRIETKDGSYNILTISNGEAKVIEADCANQVCVHTAPASKVGDMIICLPHKVSVVIEK